jgi:hypothetical protein
MRKRPFCDSFIVVLRQIINTSEEIPAKPSLRH